MQTLTTLRYLLLGAALATLTACSSASRDGVTQDAIFDPYEASNRSTHDVNKALDRNVLRPVARAYTAVVPDGIEDNVSHFAANLSVPGAMVNQILQGRPGPATRNLARFAINSTLGFGGLADVASDMGLPEDDADFGQTLAVWGAPQGAYLELPALGPSTERAATGRFVDLFLNPLNVLKPPESTVGSSARVLAGIGARGRFGSTIDGLLYESADSYAATRDIYLQNRAFELEKAGVAPAEDDDIYADIFGE